MGERLNLLRWLGAYNIAGEEKKGARADRIRGKRICLLK